MHFKVILKGEACTMYNYEKWLTPDGLMLLECWARDGLNNQQIADKMGISAKCLWEWRNRFDEIETSLRRGKEVVDYGVENALLKSALGGERRTSKTIVDGKQDGDGNRNVRVETTVEEVMPSVTACLAWLNNRKPDKWKRNRDMFDDNSEDKTPLQVTIVKKAPDGSEIKLSGAIDNEDASVS